MVTQGCAGGRFDRPWGDGISIAGFDPGADAGETAAFALLVPLSKIFYGRIANRRFNSKATYDDPALREYFHSGDAFADYYANFADALERAHFESHRPTAVWLDRAERTAPNRAQLHVRFEGENGLPLRWWSTRVLRVDEWEYVEGRWWIIPGKV